MAVHPFAKELAEVVASGLLPPPELVNKISDALAHFQPLAGEQNLAAAFASSKPLLDTLGKVEEWIAADLEVAKHDNHDHHAVTYLSERLSIVKAALVMATATAAPSPSGQQIACDQCEQEDEAEGVAWYCWECWSAPWGLLQRLMAALDPVRAAELDEEGTDSAKVVDEAIAALRSPATLSLGDLREANATRQQEWDPSNDLNMLFRGVELAGEVGEALNVVKKLERERLGKRGSRASRDDLGTELADVQICLDLLAMAAGVDLSAATVEKFNATSEKLGLKTRLKVRQRPVLSDHLPAAAADLRHMLGELQDRLNHAVRMVPTRDGK